jgi:predicted hydrolase (HD superfamily)
MSFEASFGDRLSTVSEEDAAAVKSILELDEELRKDEPDEPVDTDDVLAMEQPDLLEFVRDHVEVALETAEGEEPVEIDVDAVDKVYRMVLAIVLSLSRAVTPPAYFPTAKAEWTA